jgi:hypothetical protein
MRRLLPFLMLVTLASACGRGAGNDAERDTGETPGSNGRPVALEKDAYAVFPDPDSGADPAIPAEQGGRGFTGDGWETNADHGLIGDPRAVKGGILRQAMMTDFPATLRYYGPNVSEWNPTFPKPDVNWLSQLADQKNNNNITGFKNARADQIMLQYQKTFDIAARTKLLQELDGIFTAEHHWVFEWTAPYERVAFWHKFGYPQGHLSRIGSFRDIVRLWWIDPERSRRLAEATRDQSIDLGEGATDDRYWLEFAKAETEGARATR